MIQIGNEINPATIKSGKNVEILRAPSTHPEPLWQLSKMKGIRSLLVEGGAKVHGSFIKSECVTRLQLFIAPKVVYGQSHLPGAGTWGIIHRGCNGLEDFVRATPGQDFHLIVEPRSPAEACVSFILQAF